MTIQQRLSKQRYGPMNIKSPTKEDLDDYNMRTTRLRKPVPEVFDSILFHMTNPPIRDRNYLHYIYTVNQFREDLFMATKQSRWQIQAQITDIHMAGKLLYMNNHPSRFHGFHNFKYTWLFDTLCAMRTYSIGQAYRRGEIQTTNSHEQWSAGFIRWPKPMGERAGSALADILYEVVFDRSEYIEGRSLLYRS